MRKVVVSICIVVLLLSLSAVSVAASPRTPHSFNCGSGFDVGCAATIDWTGAANGSRADPFTNQYTPGTGVNVFVGTWVFDDNHADCQSLPTKYCYMKIGYVAFGGGGGTKFYGEYLLPGMSNPTVKTLVFQSNDYGKTANAEIFAFGNGQYTMESQVSANSHQLQFNTSNAGDFATDIIATGIQVLGSSSGTFTGPENDITSNQYFSVVTGAFKYQTNGGTKVMPGPTPCVKWLIVPATGNNGGKLKTDDVNC